MNKPGPRRVVHAVGADAEVEAIRRDAEHRLAVLFEARSRLLPDADDAWTLSELVCVEGQIRSALAVVRGQETAK